MTDEEREAWKDAYRLHELMHDMSGTPEDWQDALRQIKVYLDSRQGDSYELCRHLMLAVYDHMSALMARRIAAGQNEPAEQMRMEDIPWT